MTDTSKDKAAFSRSKIGGEAPMVVGMIAENTLYSGFFGTLDSARVQIITERILETIVASNADYVIVDLGNVDLIDSAVAARLFKIADAIKTVGAASVFTGISPAIAQTMVEVGASLASLRTKRDLKAALQLIYNWQGIELVKKHSSCTHLPEEQ